MIGSTFVDLLDRFEEDPETELVVLVGEIGGDEEEKAARHVAAKLTTRRRLHRRFLRAPGQDDGPRGRDHRRFSGTAEAKKEALEAAGIQVGTTPTEVAGLVAARLAAPSG